MIFDANDPEHVWITDYSWGVQTTNKKIHPLPEKLEEFKTMDLMDLIIEIDSLDRVVGPGLNAKQQKPASKLNMFPSILVD
jgi:hypothetical protein